MGPCVCAWGALGIALLADGDRHGSETKRVLRLRVCVVTVFRARSQYHTPGYEGIFGPFWAESRLPHP
jgi:hypothetical protein